MSGTKTMPLTKQEVMYLVELIEENPVLFSKATNASNNQLKEATWTKITQQFNSTIASCPRKPEQLRLKWENLKKTARKRTAKIRMNNLKTGGGKPDYIPPDDTLDKVVAILGPTCGGYSVFFGGDAEAEIAGQSVLEGAGHSAAEATCDDQGLHVIDITDLESTEVKANTEICVPFNQNEKLIETSPMRSTPPKTTRQKFFFSSTTSKGKLKRQSMADDLQASTITRNLAIASYYDAKRKQDEEIATIKKIKLQLEIEELKNRLTK